MPPSTRNLIGMIVYVPPHVKAGLDARAASSGSNPSAEVRRVLLREFPPPVATKP